MYDVIVAGAGPAGSAAARALAQNGLRVLLVERFRLPRNKSCSGILIGKTLELVRCCFGEDVPASVTCAPAENRGMIFTDDLGREYRFEQPGLNVWRSSFDGWLTEKAAESSAEVRDRTGAIDCLEEDDGVTVTLRGETVYTETARWLLDCEGVTGVLKRRLTGMERDYITTFQTFCRGTVQLDPHYFYAYLQPELSGYDAWFNVKDGMLVLGVSAKDAGRLPDFHRRFLAYMEDCHGLRLERQVRAERWLMPRIRPGCPILWGGGRMLFAGEAAGFLNPMGEGISAGIESGICAARAVSEWPDQPDRALEAYRQEAEPLRRYMERQWDFTARMAGTFREMRLQV